MMLQFPTKGKFWDLAGKVALNVMNIMPFSIGLVKMDYSKWTKFKNIASDLETDPLNFHG